MQYINGTWIEGSGSGFVSENPATGEVIWRGKSAETLQVAAAVNAAREAFETWSATPLEERIGILSHFRDLIETNKYELAKLISQETGKTLWDAESEAGAAIGKLKFSLAAHGERTPLKQTDLNGSSTQLTHRPHGVMAVYGPYNFPAHLPGGHIIPALLAGNTVVFKPSELTPKVGEWLLHQWEAAELPPGVLNLIQGERDTGIALSHAAIDGLLFTGSSTTGKALHGLFAGKPEILLALELGGNNALIVDEISNIQSAVLETILSAYISSGQRCTCARRLIVVGQNQPYLDALREAITQLVVGKPTDKPEPFMGPVISNRVAKQLLGVQESLLSSGAKALVAMRQLDDSLPLLSPGLLDVTDVTDLPDEEHFGPLLQVIRVPDLDTAIKIANSTQYGLSAGLLSDNPESWQQCQLRLKAGIINWNQQTTGASGMAPFGGIGASGNHHPAGYYSADYCSYPVASMLRNTLTLPESLPPGITL